MDDEDSIPTGSELWMYLGNIYGDDYETKDGTG